MFFPSTRTAQYQQHCVTSPLIPSAVGAVIFSGIDALQGARLTPRGVGTYMGIIYAYNIIQCPMEYIHGRQSLMHNVLSAGTLGYLGVSTGKIGIPFLDPHAVYSSRNPALLGAAVYGAMAGCMAALGGKSM